MSESVSPDNSNDFIEKHLGRLLKGIGDLHQADAITFAGGLTYEADDLVRDAIEDISGNKPRLLFILETTGGSIDVAERIASTLRHHYTVVDFLIPNHAYSAGTILTMSGDAIFMDYYGVLGPIDPQIRKEGVGWVPALGYLSKYEELIEKSANGKITDAEVAFLVNRFDPAELHAFENAKNQSVTLLKKWLVNYKFKDWNETETKKTPVTEQMKQQRAEEIAEILNDTKLWHSHNRGIPISALREIVNLKIEDFGKIDEMARKIRKYYRLLKDYMLRRGYDGVLHTEKDLTRVWS